MGVTTVGGAGLVPQGFDQAFKLAEWMAKSKLMPEHLHNDAPSCLLVIEQAKRWGMSPFAVGQCTSVIHGRLMFEGKLVSAALTSSGLLADRPRYKWSGEGEMRTVAVSATLVGEKEPRTVSLIWKDAATKGKDGKINGQWTRDPDQQLSYAVIRKWARLYAPEVLLGVYAPEEFDAPREPAFRGETIEGEAGPTDRDDIAEAERVKDQVAQAETVDALRDIIRRPDVVSLGDRLKIEHPEVAADLAGACRGRSDKLKTSSKEAALAKFDETIDSNTRREPLRYYDADSGEIREGAPEPPTSVSANPDDAEADAILTDLNAAPHEYVAALGKSERVQSAMRKWKTKRPDLFKRVEGAFAGRMKEKAA